MFAHVQKALPVYKISQISHFVSNCQNVLIYIYIYFKFVFTKCYIIAMLLLCPRNKTLKQIMFFFFCLPLLRIKTPNEIVLAPSNKFFLPFYTLNGTEFLDAFTHDFFPPINNLDNTIQLKFLCVFSTYRPETLKKNNCHLVQIV